MDKLSALNFAVAAVVSFMIAGITLKTAIAPPPKETRYRVLNSNEYPGAVWALRLWGIWWFMMFFTYLGIDKYPYSYALVISNLGDICMLGAAISYCLGQRPKVRLLIFLGGVFILGLIWNIAMPVFFNTPQGRILVISPSTVISSIAVVAFGWSVVVRCGWPALPFLLLTALYALAQLPAYFDKIVLKEGDQVLRNTHFNKLHLVFIFLAIGKVLYALAFFGYFFSPEHDSEALKQPKYLPSEDVKVKMHPTYARFFRWFVIIVVTSFLTALAAAVVPGFTDWVKEFFNLKN